MRVAIAFEADDPVTRVLEGLADELAARGVEVALQPTSLAGFDAAIFLAYENGWRRVRAEHPGLRLVLADPKQSRAEWIEAAREADLLIVSSVEQRDAFLRLNRNAVVYPMCPPLPAAARSHENRDPLVVAYHGNRVHLECMVRGAKQAIEALGRRRPVEFVAVYNIAALGLATIGVPEGPGVRVRHVQWTDEVAPGSLVSQAVVDELARADIGIVPTEQPIRNRLDALERMAFHEPQFVHEPFDHLLRLKASTNAGRLWPFARLAVPVVADFAPSLTQLVDDGVSGMLASSPHGWLDALETLAADPELRTSCAAELNRRMEAAVARGADDLVRALGRPRKDGPVAFPGFATAEDELARLPRFGASPPPRIRSTIGRAAGRAIRAFRSDRQTSAEVDDRPAPGNHT